jgi:peroxiredoxin
MPQVDTRQAMQDALNRARSLDAPVQARLAIISDALRNHFPLYVDAVDRLVARLKETGAGQSAPTAGAVMPPFLLPDQNRRLVGLDDLLARGPVVMAFHRGHWCPYCRTNTHALNQIHNRIVAKGGQLVAITPEREAFTRAQRDDVKGTFPILSDVGNGYALTLNLVVWIDDELQRFLRGFGRDLPVYHGNASWFLPLTATFVVATNGTIQARFVDPDHRRRMDLDDVVAAVTALS